MRRLRQQSRPRIQMPFPELWAVSHSENEIRTWVTNRLETPNNLAFFAVTAPNPRRDKFTQKVAGVIFISPCATISSLLLVPIPRSNCPAGQQPNLMRICFRSDQAGIMTSSDTFTQAIVPGMRLPAPRLRQIPRIILANCAEFMSSQQEQNP
jgi:hypothetical protein